MCSLRNFHIMTFGHMIPFSKYFEKFHEFLLRHEGKAKAEVFQNLVCFFVLDLFASQCKINRVRKDLLPPLLAMESRAMICEL